MLLQLPEQADPKRLCEQSKDFAGSVAIKELQRLTPLLASSEGEVSFTLAFDRDAERRLRVRGTVRGELVVICQRCLGPMTLPVDASFQLSPVNGPKEAEALPEDYDPLLIETRLMHPLDLIEDELILAIPPAPRHLASACQVDMRDFQEQPEQVESTESKPSNPFAVLSELKKPR